MKAANLCLLSPLLDIAALDNTIEFEAPIVVDRGEGVDNRVIAGAGRMGGLYINGNVTVGRRETSLLRLCLKLGHGEQRAIVRVENANANAKTRKL